ncbi:LacI family DNA-binding transcriptional regulator [Caproiciproducens sp. R1]|uniref:LacI family DNA-binding transcriptional regulator n=1 Tax=Caproiciproducens sp. R1 TaxID=3435000 RepID=UPI004033F639
MADNLKDIANEVGLSVSTISRVVNGKSYVAPATKRRVMKALEKHKYAPNQIARSLKMQSTNTVGIIVPDIRDYFANVIKGADTIFSEAGYSIILADSNESDEKEEKYLKLLYEKRIDGLVLATVSQNSKALQMYFENDIPVVFIDNLPNLNTSYDAVLLDNVKASMMAVNHIVDCGYNKIAIISGKPAETTAVERVDGYKHALMHHNLSVDPALIMSGDYTAEDGYRCMMKLLENKAEHEFEAVFATSYKMTCGAMKAIKEKGLKYPDDIALVGFDFADESDLFTPKITSILQPIDSIGKLVAERLISQMKDTNRDSKHNFVNTIPRRILLDPILKMGESCGCRNRNQ